MKINKEITQVELGTCLRAHENQCNDLDKLKKI